MRLPLAFAVCCVGALAPTPGQERPNIVFILADDLAWSDLGCFGHPYHHTPNLDRLASDGARFTQAYAPAPICSASRAAILTGKTPARLGFEFVTKEKPGSQELNQPLRSPPFTLDLPLEAITIGEVLSASGYRTGFFGKWHVSRHHGGYLRWSPTHGPHQQGFADGDADFGSHPWAYLKREGREFADLADGQFSPDALTDRAIGFLRSTGNAPFFLCWSHYFVHDPIHTRCRWLQEKYRAKLPPGTDEIRATYASMVETMDHQIGRLLDALDQLGLANGTLVVFTSDNGGHPNYTANGPLRGSKWNLYEGGIRVPMIARWPGVIQAGCTRDGPITGCDLFPTFRDVARAPADDIPRDGQSLLPLLRVDPAPAEPRALVWHFPYYHPERKFAEHPAQIGINDFATSQTRPHSAIRLGDHKLIHCYEDDRDELYDLAEDPSEQRDLAATEPTRAAALRRALDDYLGSVRARLPIQDPATQHPRIGNP